jgi:hypothetical protein
MTSYRIKISPKDRAVGRFINRVVKELQKAFAEEKAESKLTQQAVAERLGVGRSSVNKMLVGRNLTLRSVGELAWALDREVVFQCKKRAPERDKNFYVGTSSDPGKSNVVVLGSASVKETQAGSPLALPAHVVAGRAKVTSVAQVHEDAL